MAKPCRYRQPGTDTWLSEADFKKTLNDGLLDKHIEDGIISIRGFKAKAETAQPVTEAPIVEAPVAEVKEEGKFFIDGKEVSEEEAIKEIQDESRQYDFNLSGKKIEYQGSNEQFIRATKEHNKSVSPFNSEGKLKSSYIDSAIRKAFNSFSLRKFGNAYRKHIDPYFTRANNEARNGGNVGGKNGMTWEELAGYIISDDTNLATEEQFSAFAKDLGLEVPTQEAAPVAETKQPEAKSKSELEKEFNALNKQYVADDKLLTEATKNNQGTTDIESRMNDTQEKMSEISNQLESSTETQTEAPKAESNTEKITRGADMLKNMSEEERDNFIDDWFSDRIPRESLPGGSDAIKLYEARIVAPKPMNKPKRLTMDNAFELSNEHGFIININGELYGLSKVEDPDSTSEAEDKFGDPKEYVWIHSKISEGIDGKTTETYTSDINEVIDNIKSSKSTKAEPKAEPVKKEKAPKAEAKESYKAKAIDKRGGEKSYTVTVNGNTADVVGEQRPSPMDNTKMVPGASHKALPITTNINGQRVVETPTGDTIYLDKPITEKAEETTEAKERVSEGKGANITVDVPGRSVSSPVVKMVKNKRTNQWQALRSDGTTYETSDTLKDKAEAIYQQTRTGAKVVSLPALEAGTRNRQMVFSNTTNKWMEVNGEGILINVTEPSAKAAEETFKSKREDLKRKIADAFDSKKFNLKGQLNSTPIIQISWNAILELTKKLVLAGADLTFAINDAAKKVTDQMVKENKMTEAEAQEVINYVSSDDFRLRPEYSGMKNALASDASKELSAEKIDKMTYKEALDAGQKAIESGEINPSEIIDHIVNVKGRTLEPIETVAMAYYRVGLDNDLADLYKRFSEENNEDIKDLLLNEIKIVEEKISNYDVMSRITGYFTGLTLALRRVMINSQYDATMMINKVRAKYGDAKMPEGLEEKLREASNKIKDLNKEIEKLKKEAEKSSDSEAVNDIKEDNARRKGKKKTKEEGTHVSSKDGNVAVSTALIREAVEKGATEIEDVINYVRADVQAMFPDATDRQIRDAISNYGKQVNPNQDKIQQEINGIKSVGRMLSKLEDIQKALANESAFDNLKNKKARDRARRKLSEREEQLKRAIREEMAKLPLSVEDIEFINEQKLESYKKRKQNEIAELDEKILRNDLAKKGKQSTILDKEGQELKDKRDALKSELDELRKKQPLTDEQIEENRAKRLEQYKKRLADRNKDLKRRIAEKDFSKKAKPESIKRDEEARKLEIEREKLIYEYELELAKAEMAAAPIYKKALNSFFSFVNLPKALKAAIDLSAPLRQGIVPLLTQNPKKSIDQTLKMMKFFANPKSYEAFMDELRSSEYYPLLKESGLFIAEQNGKLNAMEEMLSNNLGNKIPILGSTYKLKSGKKVLPGLDLYKKSEYAYSGFLNNIRVQTFLEGVGALKEMGYTLDANKDEFKSWASYVNNATGRGTMNANAAMTLGAVFFSPRLIAARMNVAMNPFYYAKLSPAARKMAMKKTAAFFAMATTITGLAALWYNNDDDDDTSVELDPRSSDFGKIKIGNTRIDFLGGFLPYFRSASQFATGEKKSLTSGQIEELNQKYGSTTRGSIAMDFFANKLAPTTRIGYDWMFKTESEKQRDLLEKEQDNSIWNDLGYPVWAQDLTVPIWTQDIKKLNQEHGVGPGSFLTGLNLFGAGVQNFEPRYKATKSSSSNDTFEDYSEFTEYDTEGSDDYSDFPGVKK